MCQKSRRIVAVFSFHMYMIFKVSQVTEMYYLVSIVK